MKSMKIFMLTGAVAALVSLGSCSNRKDNPPPSPAYYNVPDGGTAVIDDTDLSNKGLLVNKSTTTWILKGNVTIDDLSVVGKVIIDPGANVQVKGLVNIAGGANLQVNGNLTTTTLTQTGNSFFNGANVTIGGQYTIAGGCVTYLQNSKVTVKDLRILGAITGLENDATKNGNVYSVFYFPENNPYLNRAGGTNVCGPVLFTYNNDQGASGVKMTDVTSTALNIRQNLRTVYQLPENSTFYQYGDQNCTPLSKAPGF